MGGSDAPALSDSDAKLVEDLLAGSHRALARVITRIENRAAGYRGIVAALHEHTGGADVIGITGAPGAGKSTLVDKLAAAYRDRGDTVGVVAVDPSSPYTGGAVLGDRIRMASNVGDMDVFFRSMSARGQLGGLSMATADAVKALDAFGKDVVIIETVGAGQNEVDVVRTADTVAVLVQPGSGDDVQTLKAGILEIGDVFVVNKADMDGAERTLAELEEMVHRRASPTKGLDGGHHGFEVPDHPDDGEGDGDDGGGDDEATEWTPEVLRTVANTGEGVSELIETFDAHAAHLHESGAIESTKRRRYAEEIRTLVRSDVGALATAEIERRGGIDALADSVRRRETDPYSLAAEIVDPIAECVEADGGDDGRPEPVDRDAT
ncbi:methylmalonyl Co-A mutase-associated GTPase MeaB [Halorubrum lacusprofundi]|jgi:LAO/AO transport system kinase|uniref:LAO/AO transport system ATPase n=1 Tax=Halorubrum lacusprofundi (strain ATCC 49239 / DSM 5036 / JCM 8891 / ACAM 34) TaxID=416348 RepID=B9LT48_HALLT|nr:methylmalonyl Co-A mutase-associated GTPase MeaB [Halorubrum lacusprofundi]ACM56113.1 LAO/AO transport system ATPase [Halorubrum lacusprofundi ATCC 49239]MCG1005576.1 methylmalonyl Co-A mutase-associated GTPase MeaB [Halorubrum lacusprofundi]